MGELEAACKLLADTELLAEDNRKLTRVCQKLSKKIKADVMFLEKLNMKAETSKSVNKKKSTLPSSSNIPYLTGIFDVVKHSSDVTDVVCDMKKYGIIIDVVCDGGKTWKKVIARNPQSLHLIWAGRGQYGNKDIVKKVEKYVYSAKLYSDISPPHIACVFCNGVTHEVGEALEKMGVSVEGERVDVSQLVLDKLVGVFDTSSEESEGEANSDLEENDYLLQVSELYQSQ